MNTVQENMTTWSSAELERIRADFPTLSVEVHGKPLVYLDNGATAMKPQVVIDAVSDFYASYNSNVHRGVHKLSDAATRAFETARSTARAFLNAGHEHEVIFTKGTTDGINLVAQSFGDAFIQAGDEIIYSAMEHHSNLVPWQMMARRKGAVVRHVPVNDRGELDMDAYRSLFSEKTKIVALVHVSNTLGTINPAKELVEIAHGHGVPVLLDGAQAVPHMQVDVQDLDVDFYALSGHKIFGPTGTGILYGKEKWLNAMPPYQGGGSMIDHVGLETTTYNQLPHKFEAGTPHIAGFIGLEAAMSYMMDLGMDRISAHEADLLAYTTAALEQIEGMRIIGTANEKAAVISFLIDGIHPSDLGQMLDMHGIAVRTGHHCTQPLMERFGVTGTVRASFAFYNSREDADRFITALKKVIQMFK